VKEADELLELIDPSSFQWSPDEIKIAVAIKKKYARCTRNGQQVPEPVFEANAEGNKTVNSDCAIIWTSTHGVKKIYLSKRSQGQAYAGKLHLPGTTHRYEDKRTATERLLAGELKAFRISYHDLNPPVQLDLQDPPRGPVQSNLFVIHTRIIPLEYENDFFSPADLPWDQLVVSHRMVTLPYLIQQLHI